MKGMTNGTNGGGDTYEYIGSELTVVFGGYKTAVSKSSNSNSASSSGRLLYCKVDGSINNVSISEVPYRTGLYQGRKAYSTRDSLNIVPPSRTVDSNSYYYPFNSIDELQQNEYYLAVYETWEGYSISGWIIYGPSGIMCNTLKLPEYILGMDVSSGRIFGLMRAVPWGLSSGNKTVQIPYYIVTKRDLIIPDSNGGYSILAPSAVDLSNIPEGQVWALKGENTSTRWYIQSVGPVGTSSTSCVGQYGSNVYGLCSISGTDFKLSSTTIPLASSTLYYIGGGGGTN